MYNPHACMYLPQKCLSDCLYMYMYMGVPGERLGLVVVCAFNFTFHVQVQCVSHDYF